jgi:hypothetical protein
MITDLAVVVEDDLSLAVLDRILSSSSRQFKITRPFVSRGFGNIKRSINTYRQASRIIPHIILTDLDNAICAASLIRDWKAENLPASMMLRVAVREVESWILADQESFSKFAKIPKKKIPLSPDLLADPKQTLVNLVRHSSSRRLAAEIVPAAGSRAQIGPLYNEKLSTFVLGQWDPVVAAASSPSLLRTRGRLETFLR